MGSGKSTIGSIIANKIGWEFCDLDRYIENKMGMKISKIFEEKGEPEFRLIESDCLKEVSAAEEIIISLGGGTIVFHDNLAYIKKLGKVVYLQTTAEKVYLRLRYKNDRPVLKLHEQEGEKEEVIAKIQAMMDKRDFYYQQADIIFRTDNLPIGKSVDMLAKIMERDI